MREPARVGHARPLGTGALFVGGRDSRGFGKRGCGVCWPANTHGRLLPYTRTPRQVKVGEENAKSRDAARPFDQMPPRLRPPAGTGTFRLRARPGSARASVSHCSKCVFVLTRLARASAHAARYTTTSAEAGDFQRNYLLSCCMGHAHGHGLPWAGYSLPDLIGQQRHARILQRLDQHEPHQQRLEK